MASRRPHARSPDSHHRRHTRGRQRIALPPDRGGRTSGPIPPARRLLRPYARAAPKQKNNNLQHKTNLHNLPEHGTVWVTTSVQPKGAVLTVENTGEKLTPQAVATLVEPFQRGSKRIRTDHAGAGLGLAIVTSITQAHDGTLTLTPRAVGGLGSPCKLPAPQPNIANGGQGNFRTAPL